MQLPNLSLPHSKRKTYIEGITHRKQPSSVVLPPTLNFIIRRGPIVHWKTKHHVRQMSCSWAATNKRGKGMSAGFESPESHVLLSDFELFTIIQWHMTPRVEKARIPWNTRDTDKERPYLIRTTDNNLFRWSRVVQKFMGIISPNGKDRDFHAFSVICSLETVKYKAFRNWLCEQISTSPEAVSK